MVSAAGQFGLLVGVIARAHQAPRLPVAEALSRGSSGPHACHRIQPSMLLGRSATVPLRQAALLGILIAGSCICRQAEAQKTPHDFTFSTRVYVTMNSFSRFWLQGENAWHLTNGKRAWESTGGVDFLLEPILKPIIKTPNIARDDYLLLRIGDIYRQKWGSRRGHNEEGFISFLARLPLPHNWEVADRNRVDLRSQGGFSWRYRNRPVVDWSWKRGYLTLQPYSQTTFFYDSRYQQISRIGWNSGVVIGKSRTMLLEPSYTRRWDEQPGGQRYSSFHLRVDLYF